MSLKNVRKQKNTAAQMATTQLKLAKVIEYAKKLSVCAKTEGRFN